MAKQKGKAGPADGNIPDLTLWLRGLWEGAPSDETPDGDITADWLAPFNLGEKRLRGMKPRDLRDAVAKAEFYSWYSQQGCMEPVEWGLEAALHDLKILLRREKGSSGPATVIDSTAEEANESLDQPSDSGNLSTQPSEEERFSELYKHLDERQAKGIKDCDAVGAYDIAVGLEDPLRNLERARATLYLVALTEGLEDDVHDALIFLSNTLEETVEDVDTKVSEIHHKLWAIGQGYYDVVPAKHPGSRDSMTDGQIERLQDLINEERSHARKVQAERGAERILAS